MKTCIHCKQEKTLDSFYSDVSRKDKRSNRCKECDKAAVKARTAKNKDTRLAYNRHYWEENKATLNAARSGENRKPLTEEQKQRQRERSRAHYKENKETIKIRHKEWRANNRDKEAYYAAKRRASKLKATPAWANLEYIADLYSNAQEANAIFKDYGILFHVDHIIPLQNALVCGLHTEDNLQILSAKDNQRKSNYYEVI